MWGMGGGGRRATGIGRAQVAVKAAALLLIALRCAAAAPGPAATDAMPRSIDQDVLVLSSVQQGLPVSDAVIETLVSDLTRRGISVNDLYIEALDVARNTDSDYKRRLAGLLKDRLRNAKPAVVIVVNQPALGFLANEGRELLPPGVPVLTILVQQPNVPWREAPPPVIHFPDRVDVAGTLNDALAIFPDTRRLVVVAGPDDTRAPFLAATAQALGSLTRSIDVEYTSNLPYEDMLKRVGSLPPNSLLLYGPYFADVTGRSFVPAEVAAAVGRAANAPVFAFYDAHIKAGLTGGSVLMQTDVGRAAASAANEIIRGTRRVSAGITIVPVSLEHVLDWAQIKRWGGEVSAIPSSAFVRNRPATLWTQYRNQVLLAAAVIASLTVLLAMAIVENRRRHRVALKLRESEQRWQFALEGSAQGVWDWDMVRDKVYYTHAYGAMLGYTVEELGDSVEEQRLRICPEDLPMVQATMAAHRRGETRLYRAEYRVRCKDGHYIWGESRGMIIERTDNGAPTRMIGTLADVTERRQASAKLAESAAKLAAALENMSDAVSISDTQGRFVEFNSAFATFHRFRNKAECKKVLAEFPSILEVHMADGTPAPLEQWAASRALRGETGINVEYVLRRLDTGERWLGSYNFAPIRDHSGAITGSVVVRRDITEQARAAQEVAKLNVELVRRAEAAEIANRAKSAFLAMMSHELRTPLNGIMGMTGLALGLVADTKAAQYLNESQQASQHLLQLISDLLDLTRIEAEELTLIAENFTLGAVIERVNGILGPAAVDKQLLLDVAMDPELARRPLIGDAGRLGQILINLIGNAIKFTFAGGVTVRVAEGAEDAEQMLVRCEVHDTGIGISAQDQQRLFQMFEQVDMSLTRPFGGTGLGLYIARRLVEQMGGAIGVTSDMENGSTFWFTVRLRKGIRSHATVMDLDADAAKRHLRRLHTGARVLLVEDEALNRNWVAEALRSAGLVVDTAKNGQQAVECASRTEYACIVMDVKMPVMDGLEATRRIRALPGRDGMSIVALTALAYPGDRAHCLEAGMNDCIVKPIEPARLYELMMKWLRPNAPSSP